MSIRHPIIAITGSSGAGTTSVTRTFENIFRRESIKAAVIEGDSFHRFDRKTMKIAAAEAEDPDRRLAMGRAARAFVAAEYDFDRAVGRYEETYGTVVGRHEGSVA